MLFENTGIITLLEFKITRTLVVAFTWDITLKLKKKNSKTKQNNPVEQNSYTLNVI